MPHHWEQSLVGHDPGKCAEGPTLQTKIELKPFGEACELMRSDFPSSAALCARRRLSA